MRRTQAGQVGPREVASVAYGVARYGSRSWQRLLFAALARTAEWQLSEFNAQGLANTAWASATVSYRDQKLFAAVTRAAERRLSDFIAQDRANTAWVFATVQRPDMARL